MKRMLAVLALAATAVGLSGCALLYKGSLHYNRTTPIGKELVDLQEAKTKDSLTDEEYAKAKKDILEGGPQKFEASCSGWS